MSLATQGREDSSSRLVHQIRKQPITIFPKTVEQPRATDVCGVSKFRGGEGWRGRGGGGETGVCEREDIRLTNLSSLVNRRRHDNVTSEAEEYNVERNRNEAK